MGVFSPCVKGRGQMKNVGDEQNQCSSDDSNPQRVGASPATAVAARRRGAPRAGYRLPSRGEALATSKGRRGGAGTLRRRLDGESWRAGGDTGEPGRVTLTTGR